MVRTWWSGWTSMNGVEKGPMAAKNVPANLLLGPGLGGMLSFKIMRA